MSKSTKRGYYPHIQTPDSTHVETLVLLFHKKPDGHINIKLEFGEDKDSISAEELLKKAENTSQNLN